MRAGNEEALVELYRATQPGIYRFALQMCGSQELAGTLRKRFHVLMREAHTFDPARVLERFSDGDRRHTCYAVCSENVFYVSMNEPRENGGSVTTTHWSLWWPIDEISRTESIEALIRDVLLCLSATVKWLSFVICRIDMGKQQRFSLCEGTYVRRLHRARAL